MQINYEKYADGLVPAIVQDAETNRVLMLGFMNAAAFDETEKSGNATFYSRSRRTLWTKGETSGNFLRVQSVSLDCDADTLLIKAVPSGAICHTGADTCFDERNEAENFLFELEETIRDRKANPSDASYTTKLFRQGINKIAQKVGEEAVELVIEAKDNDDELFKNEAADLLYHLFVLFAEKNIELKDVLGNAEEKEEIVCFYQIKKSNEF